MKNIVSGSAWVFGDNVNTESIMATGTDFNPALAAKTCLAFYDAEFPGNVKPGDIIVAGKNFGNSSSRPAGKVLKHLGVAAIVCESCARIFSRNTWNIGVPILECPGISAMFTKGDHAQVDLDSGEIQNLTSGESKKADKPIDILVERWRAGGMIDWINARRDQYDTLE
jgi:3-isopropylmalate/(R)-2-methylmalate dehydratase small subunit